MTDDDDLWKEITKDIKPIKQKKRQPPVHFYKRGWFEPKTNRVLQHMPVIQSSLEFLRGGVDVYGRAHRVGGHADRRSKAGKIPIEARLDLHGLTLDQAHKVLSHFIISCHEEKKRCVLIITGKGGSKGEGKLRRELPYWMRLSPIESCVMEFTQAQLQHGGEGAFYVFLKR